MLLQRYPLDQTGRSPTNLVEGEVHTLDVHTDFRLVFPNNGAYFNDSLVVRQGSTTLQLNKDYLYTFLWHDATTALGQGVSTALQITNKNLIGDIQISYQVVGGAYQERIESLDNVLNTLPLHTRDVYWDEVRERPEAYWPARHLHHINDVFGLSRLVAVVDDLRRSLQNQSVLKLKVVYDRFLKLKQYVEANLKDIDKVREEFAKLLNDLDEKTDGFVTRDELNSLVKNSVKENITEEIESQLAPLREKNDEQDVALENLRTLVDNVTNKVDTEIKASLSTIGDKVKTVEDNINALDGRLTSSINDAKTKLDDAKQALRDEFANSNRGIQQLIESNKSELQEAISNVNNNIRSTETSLTESLNRINARVDGVTQSANESVNTLIEKLNTDIAECKKIAADADTSLREDLITRINHINIDLDTKLEQYAKVSEVDTKLYLLENDLKAYADTQDANTLGLAKTYTDEKLADQSTLLDTAKTELETKLNSAKTDIENKLDEVKSSLDTFKDDHEKAGLTSAEDVRRLVEQAKTDTFEQAKQYAKQYTDTVVTQLGAANSEDVTRLIDAVKTEINQSVTEKVNEAKTQVQEVQDSVTTQLGGISGRVDTLAAEVDKVKNNNGGSTVDISRLERKVNEAIDDHNKLKSSHQKLSDTVGGFKTTISDLIDFRNAFGSIVPSIEEQLHDFSADMMGTKHRIEHLESRTQAPTAFTPNEENIGAIVKKLLDKALAESRPGTSPSEVPITPPENGTNVEFTINEAMRAFGIASLYEYEINEMNRTVYAPIQTLEWERNDTFVVPDQYDKTLAEVYVISALRVKELGNGKVVYYPPSVKKDYVLLKGGTTVPITVGLISSFGTHISNDGLSGEIESEKRSRLIVPTYPIIVDTNASIRGSDDIRNYAGKFGKVILKV